MKCVTTNNPWKLLIILEKSSIKGDQERFLELFFVELNSVLASICQTTQVFYRWLNFAFTNPSNFSLRRSYDIAIKTFCLVYFEKLFRLWKEQNEEKTYRNCILLSFHLFRKAHKSRNCINKTRMQSVHVIQPFLWINFHAFFCAFQSFVVNISDGEKENRVIQFSWQRTCININAHLKTNTRWKKRVVDFTRKWTSKRKQKHSLSLQTEKYWSA